MDEHNYTPTKMLRNSVSFDPYVIKQGPELEAPALVRDTGRFFVSLWVNFFGFPLFFVPPFLRVQD